jgi:hypothetical protein
MIRRRGIYGKVPEADTEATKPQPPQPEPVQPVVQVVNDPAPTQPSSTGDNKNRAQDSPHGDIIREKLRARAKDLNSDPADREAAKEVLRAIYREEI